jgi:hypothetical protein
MKLHVVDIYMYTGVSQMKILSWCWRSDRCIFEPYKHEHTVCRKPKLKVL